jgi:hypothetical protein
MLTTLRKEGDAMDKLTTTNVGISRRKFLIGSAVGFGVLSSLGQAQTKKIRNYSKGGDPGMGTAGTFLSRDPCRVSIAPLIATRSPDSGLFVITKPRSVIARLRMDSITHV